MRQYLSIIIVLIAMSSCYRDLSTEATISIPEITIFSDKDVLNVAYGHDLVLEPEVVQEGRVDSDFTYLWEIDLSANSKNNRIEIGEDKNLTYKVGHTPSDKPYYLTLTVTDTQTGLQKLRSWEVYVSSSLGEGILVAYTRDGGKSSDVGLVTGQAMTYGYASETPLITYDIHSFANGLPLEGRINSMVTSVVTDGAVFNTTRIMLGTDNHIIALNPLDFKESERDAKLFNSKETKFATSFLFNFGDYASGAFVEKKFFTCIGNFDRAYTKTPISSKVSDIFTPSNVAYSKADQGKVLVFNPYDNKFHYASILSVSGGMAAIDEPGLSYSLEGATPIGGGALKDQVLGMIMKLSDGTYHLVTFDLTLLDPKGSDYKIEGLESIGDPVSVAFCDNTNVIYYATSKRLYSIIISGGKAAYKALSWQPDSKDEKITMVSQYAQSWYGTSHNSFNNYPFVLDYHRLQMIIVTYDETTGEGKIYLRPFSVSTGMFTIRNNGTYGGFGEITAITTTPR